jgi:hypothetical protein
VALLLAPCTTFAAVEARGSTMAYVSDRGSGPSSTCLALCSTKCYDKYEKISENKERSLLTRFHDAGMLYHNLRSHGKLKLMRVNFAFELESEACIWGHDVRNSLRIRNSECYTTPCVLNGTYVGYFEYELQFEYSDANDDSSTQANT